jgi:hypothetical protein
MPAVCSDWSRGYPIVSTSIREFVRDFDDARSCRRSRTPALEEGTPSAVADGDRSAGRSSAGGGPAQIRTGGGSPNRSPARWAAGAERAVRGGGGNHMSRLAGEDDPASVRTSWLAPGAWTIIGLGIGLRLLRLAADLLPRIRARLVGLVSDTQRGETPQRASHPIARSRQNRASGGRRRYRGELSEDGEAREARRRGSSEGRERGRWSALGQRNASRRGSGGEASRES